MNLQSAIHFLYPPRCLACGVETGSDHALCGPCWQDTPFVTGLVCDGCGLPLPGEDTGDRVLCDACLDDPHPWGRARAPLLYEGAARKMVLALKHGDRLDLVHPLARWMVPLARDVAPQGQAPGGRLVVPVPLHRLRLLRRRFNQAALLGREVARMCDMPFCPDALMRRRRTIPQEGMGRVERFANQNGAFALHPRRRDLVRGKGILLVDDVLTSGATLRGCAQALLAGGAVQVNCVVLARVARNA